MSPNERQEVPVEAEIMSPVGIPVGLFEERFLIEFACRPPIENLLVGVVEHLHTNSQIGSLLEQGLQRLELDGVVFGIRMDFPEIDDARAGQIL